MQRSYAAGIGAGNRVNWGCSRYDGSYANLVASQLNVSKDELDFTYTACSGAVVSEISQQAKALSSDQEFIMLSAVCALAPWAVLSLIFCVGRQRCQSDRHPQLMCVQLQRRAQPPKLRRRTPGVAEGHFEQEILVKR